MYIQMLIYDKNVHTGPVVAHSGAQTCDCKCDWLWVRSPLEEKNIFISLLWCRGKVQR